MQNEKNLNTSPQNIPEPESQTPANEASPNVVSTGENNIQPASTNLNPGTTSPAVTAATSPSPNIVNTAIADHKVVNDGATADPLMNLVGSQMQEKKKPTPIGIYILFGLAIIGFTSNFFDTSEYSNYFSIAMLLDLLFAIGLLVRLEIARKIYIYLAGIIILLSIGIIILLALLQHRVAELQANLNNTINNVEQNSTTITQDQKQQLNSVRDQLNSEQKLVGKAITFSYIKYGVSILEMAGVIVYLTRPKVKEVFIKLPS